MTTLDPAMGDLGYAREDHDFYPTETWVTLAAVDFILRETSWVPKFPDRASGYAIWEPAAGDGAMIGPLSKLARVYATDLVNRNSFSVSSGVDFLKVTELPFNKEPRTIITNPPYLLADEFVRHALKLTQPVNGRVAMLLRNEWDCAAQRQKIVGDHPAYFGKLVLTSRPRWIRGSTGSPRHNYAWYFWDWDKDPEEYPIIAYSQSKRAYER